MSKEEVDLLIGSSEWCFHQVMNGQMQTSKASALRREAYDLSVYLTSLISGSQIPVISLLRNSTDWNKVEWACFYGRITHIPLNIGISRSDLKDLLAEFGYGIVISDHERFRSIVNSLPGNNNLVFIHASDLSAEQRPPIELRSTHGATGRMGDVLLYTSGSTGMAKGIKHSYQSLNNSIEAFSPVIAELKVERALSFLPLSFSGERKLNYTYQRLGLDICYPSISRNLLDNIMLFKPEVMGMVPSMLDTLLGQLDHRNETCPLKYIICGGASIHKDVIHRFKQFDIRVLGVYGLTETASIGSANSLSHDKPGSAGRLLPGVKFRFGPENDISIQTGALFEGYLHQPPVSNNNYSGRPFYRTGDTGFLDKEGFLHITGRLDHKFKLQNGTWLYPEEIERALIELSDGQANKVVVALNKDTLTAIFDSNIGRSAARSLVEAYNQNTLVKLEEIVFADMDQLRTSQKSVKLSRQDIIKFAFK